MRNDMKLAKVKFLNANNEPKGRAYTYKLPEGLEVKVGDIVIPKASAKGIITEVNVPVETINFSLDKLQCIIGLAEPEPKGFDVQPEQNSPVCYVPNDDTYPLCNGNGSEDCETCSVWVDLEPDLEQ